MKEFSIFIDNLATYNSGELRGQWIDLPHDKKQLNQFLKSIDCINNEYIILDDDTPNYNLNIYEYENIELLNLLAEKLENIDINDKKIIFDYCNNESITEIIEILNVVEQRENINYIHINKDNMSSKEEALGYEVIEQYYSDLLDQFEKQKLDSGVSLACYLNFEKIGNDFAINNGYFTEDKFIFNDNEININLYDKNELLNV